MPPNSPTIVGSAVATIVESSAASSNTSRRPPMTSRTCRGLSSGGTAIVPVMRSSFPSDPSQLGEFPECPGRVSEHDHGACPYRPLHAGDSRERAGNERAYRREPDVDEDVRGHHAS